ncbi:MAG: hypothetical protein LUH05_00645 [Candidatus Gastranaerophilales bacterium]|nr:hypothetical protein [Candidatus Gastranaerophilales bacterium]
MINKLVNNTGTISGNAVQKDLSESAVAEVIQNGENKITSTLDALSVQGSAMIKKPYFMLSKGQIGYIKEVWGCDGYGYTDEDISFIASYIFNIDKNSVINRGRMNTPKLGFNYMKNCPKESKEKLYNSPAIRQIEQNIEDMGLKLFILTQIPDGEFIFGYSNASDNSEKRVFFGMENILNAKKNDPAKYEQLMELVQLTKKGKIPPYVIGILQKNANINPKFLSALKEIYKSEESAKTGDVFISDGQLKYRTGTEDIPVKMSKETFETLFPPVETMALSQGQLGDCYFVSAVYDFLKNPQAKGIIYSMFEEKKRRYNCNNSRL